MNPSKSRVNDRHRYGDTIEEVSVMEMLPQEKSYSLADVLSWPDELRIELIEGQPVMMSPPKRIHQEISVSIASQLYDFLKDKKCKVFPAPFAVRLFEQAEDTPKDVETMVEPDITVVCDSDKLDDIGCKGAPDLVIEILSDSTKRHDMITKFSLYSRAGVPEYWIVDPDGQTVQVFTIEAGQYHAPVAYTSTASVPVGVLPGCVIDLNEVFAG